MGMTIDEAIHDTEVMKEYLECRNEARAEGLGVAIETMRKYQKIADLYDYWRSGKCEYTVSCMENIGKVLRGRNDD